MSNLIQASVDVSGLQTADEVLNKSGLNWKTTKEEIYTRDGKVLPDTFAIIRTDNNLPLGVVGNVYHAYNNKDLVQTLESIVSEKLVTFKRGYCWAGGSKVGVVADIPKHLFVLGKDELAVQITARNSFDGSSPVGYSVDVLRIVCSNGLKRFVGKSFITARHSMNTYQRLIDAKDILGLAISKLDDVLNQAESMARKKVNAEMVEHFLIGLKLNKIENEPTRRENKRYNLLRTFDNGIGLQDSTYKHSVWSLYNAAIETVDHKAGITDIETKAISAEYGSGASFKQESLKEALALIA